MGAAAGDTACRQDRPADAPARGSIRAGDRTREHDWSQFSASRESRCRSRHQRDGCTLPRGGSVPHRALGAREGRTTASRARPATGHHQGPQSGRTRRIRPLRDRRSTPPRHRRGRVEDPRASPNPGVASSRCRRGPRLLTPRPDRWPPTCPHEPGKGPQHPLTQRPGHAPSDPLTSRHQAAGTPATRAIRSVRADRTRSGCTRQRSDPGSSWVRKGTPGP